MLEKYLLTNLSRFKYHLFIFFIIIAGSYLGGPGSYDWFSTINTVLTVLFFLGMIPNISLFVKNFEVEGNVTAFWISNIFVYITYFILINSFGYFIFNNQ